jgi:hypothetical protein
VVPVELAGRAPLGAIHVPVGGGGVAGWTLDVRPAGPCWRREDTLGEPGAAHLVWAAYGQAVEDDEGSVALGFHRCRWCHSALLAAGIGASGVGDRRWFELVDPAVDSDGQADDVAAVLPGGLPERG